MATNSEDFVFKNLNPDDIDHTVTEIESCCMNCFENVSIVIERCRYILFSLTLF